MRPFKTFLAAVFIFISCNPTYKPHKIIIEPDYIEVHFGRLMSRTLLDSISQAVQDNGISLQYTSLKYDGNKLNELEFVLSDGNHTGAAKTNFVNKIKPFGFKVDRRPGATLTFQVGELNGY